MRRLLATVLLVACTPAPPVATAADAQRANVALVELEQGRKLLVSKCTACHKAPLPSDPWERYMDEMAEKSKLDVPQRHLIEQYLTVMKR